MGQTLKQLVEKQKNSLTEISVNTDFEGLVTGKISEAVNYIDNLLLLNEVEFNQYRCFIAIDNRLKKLRCSYNIKNNKFNIGGVKITRINKISDYEKLCQNLSVIKSEDCIVLPICLTENVVYEYGEINSHNNNIQSVELPVFNIRGHIIIMRLIMKGDIKINQAYNTKPFDIAEASIEIIISDDIKMEG